MLPVSGARGNIAASMPSAERWEPAEVRAAPIGRTIRTIGRTHRVEWAA
jgi:hypothetical protein